MADDITGPRYALSSAIKTQLKTITNADGANWFDDDVICEYPQFNPAGYPAVSIVPDNVQSEFDTVLDNNRTYQFAIILANDVRESDLGTAYDTMRQLEDDVLDLFDNDYSLGSVSLGTNYSLIDTFAAPSSWERVTVSDTQLLVAVIRLRIHISININ